MFGVPIESRPIARPRFDAAEGVLDRMVAMQDEIDRLRSNERALQATVLELQLAIRQMDAVPA